jgi:hypothetical protein
VSQFECGGGTLAERSALLYAWRQALEGSALPDRISAVVMIASMILIWSSWAYAVFWAIKRAAL